MKNINLFLRDNLQTLKIKSNNQKSLSKKFDKIFEEIKNEIHDEKNIDVLNNNFSFSFKIQELKNFKNIKMLF